MADAEDTVSLRELYLVLRRGLAFIIVTAVVFGLLALAYKLYQGTSYTAEAVVQVIRPRVSNQPGSGLEVTVATAVDVGTYTAIAENTQTLDVVADELGFAEVKMLGDLDVSPGPGPQSGDAITLTHAVTVGSSRGAASAAEVANRWAEASVAAARELVTAPWTAASERVTADVAAREAAYQAASEEWADFLGVDEREELRRRLEALVDLDAARLERLGDVEAQAQGVAARLAAGGGSDSALQADLAALEAEADHLRTELEDSESRSDELRAAIGELERQAARLQRQVSAASLSYFRAAPAAAEIELQRDLAAGSVTVAIPAATPLQPDDRNVVTTVGAAGLVGALAATLFVFLRAAVREPEPA